MFEQVDRAVERDPVAVAQAAAVLAATVGVVRRGDVRPGLIEGELDLLTLLADVGLFDRGERRDAASTTEIGVRRADDAEHVPAVRDIVSERREDAITAVDRLLCMAVLVVGEDERHRDPAQSTGPSSGSVTVTENGMRLAEREQAALDRCVRS